MPIKTWHWSKIPLNTDHCRSIPSNFDWQWSTLTKDRGSPANSIFKFCKKTQVLKKKLGSISSMDKGGMASAFFHVYYLSECWDTLIIEMTYNIPRLPWHLNYQMSQLSFSMLSGNGPDYFGGMGGGGGCGVMVIGKLSILSPWLPSPRAWSPITGTWTLDTEGSK